MPTSAARKSTFAIFALNGFLLGMWVVHIPEIRERTGASTATLGYLLLLLGGTALLGMQVGGRLIDRFGSRVVVVVAGLALSAFLVGPGLATSTLGLAVALGFLGAFNGVIDVAQNAQAVEVERLYGRPIISGFHAFFSLGGLIAAVVGGGLIALDTDVRLTLAGAAVLGILVTLAAMPALLRPSPGTTRERGTPRAPAPWTLRVVVLSLLAFVLLLSEGVAYDWSTVHLHDSLDASKTVAAWAFGAFSITMTLVRLVADRIVARIGAAAYVQRAALVGAAGLLGAALAPNAAVGIAAWAVFGVGLAGCVPQFFSAAGNIDPAAAGTYLARVTGTGYLGLLAGPAIIGILTNWVSLTTAFAVPIVGCLLAGVLAPSALRRQEDVRGTTAG
ncbi:MFS transporter [Aeromicrobium sp. NPDC092404]|uniref:MFS transporter n=1 Tax=Aeromicrobium sp. NPDC092404 TaxID=3154976 RepID=UPI003438A2FC